MTVQVFFNGSLVDLGNGMVSGSFHGGVFAFETVTVSAGLVCVGVGQAT